MQFNTTSSILPSPDTVARRYFSFVLAYYSAFGAVLTDSAKRSLAIGEAWTGLIACAFGIDIRPISIRTGRAHASRLDLVVSDSVLASCYAAKGQTLSDNGMVSASPPHRASRASQHTKIDVKVLFVAHRPGSEVPRAEPSMLVSCFSVKMTFHDHLYNALGNNASLTRSPDWIRLRSRSRHGGFTLASARHNVANKSSPKRR